MRALDDGLQVIFLEKDELLVDAMDTHEVSARQVGTYDFLALLDTGLDLGDVLLAIEVGDIVEIGLSDDAQRLLGVQLALADIAVGDGSRGHGCCGGGDVDDELWPGGQKSCRGRDCRDFAPAAGLSAAGGRLAPKCAFLAANTGDMGIKRHQKRALDRVSEFGEY